MCATTRTASGAGCGSFPSWRSSATRPIGPSSTSSEPSCRASRLGGAGRDRGGSGAASSRHSRLRPRRSLTASRVRPSGRLHRRALHRRRGPPVRRLGDLSGISRLGGWPGPPARRRARQQNSSGARLGQVPEARRPAPTTSIWASASGRQRHLVGAPMEDPVEGPEQRGAEIGGFATIVNAFAGKRPNQPPRPSILHRGQPLSATRPRYLAKPCRSYADHRSAHRWTSLGWTCDRCHPGGPTATEAAISPSGRSPWKPPH